MKSGKTNKHAERKGQAVTDDQNKQALEHGIARVKEPHLIDIGNFSDVSLWIGLLILGLIKDALYDMAKDSVRNVLNNIKRRFGKARVRELEDNVTELIEEIKEKSNLTNDEIKKRLNDIFNDFR